MPPGLSGFTRTGLRSASITGTPWLWPRNRLAATPTTAPKHATAATISAARRSSGPASYALRSGRQLSRLGASRSDRMGLGMVQRISSTGVTPITWRPERITIATAATSATRARVSAGWSGWRKRRVAASRPRFHSI